MGLAPFNLNDLVSVDTKRLQSVLQELHTQLQDVLQVQDELQQMRGRMKELERQSPQELNERLEIVERRQAVVQELAANFEREKAEQQRLVQENISRVEATEQLCREERQDRQATEARVEARIKQAESKASECRGEARGCRDLLNEQCGRIDRLERKLLDVTSIATRALENEGSHRKDAWADTSLELEGRLGELESKLGDMYSRAEAEAMRSDLEQHDQLLSKSVEALRRQSPNIADQASCVSEMVMHRLARDATARGDSRPGVAEGEVPDHRAMADGDGDSSHCLLCRSGRALKPTECLFGTDGVIYSHPVLGGRTSLAAASFQAPRAEGERLSSSRSSPTNLRGPAATRAAVEIARAAAAAAGGGVRAASPGERPTSAAVTAPGAAAPAKAGSRPSSASCARGANPQPQPAWSGK